MTTPEYQRQQENKWLEAAKKAVGTNRELTAAGLTLAVLLQGENLHADQKFAIQSAIDNIESAIPYSLL